MCYELFPFDERDIFRKLEKKDFQGTSQRNRLSAFDGAGNHYWR